MRTIVVPDNVSPYTLAEHILGEGVPVSTVSEYASKLMMWLAGGDVDCTPVRVGGTLVVYLPKAGRFKEVPLPHELRIEDGWG